MSFIAFKGAIELGLLYAMMALGVFISYRILDVADLTVDGSFVLGAAISASLAEIGQGVWGIVLAILAGTLAGCVTAFAQTKLKIQPILAGILTMTALYSINLRVMRGRPNISLLNIKTIFTSAESFGENGKIVFLVLIVALLCALLTLFFKTQVGLSLRATGDNEDMVRASSINTDKMKFLGLGMANAIVALSGALLAQYQKFTDLNMGVGIVIIGLASMIIGETLFGRRSIFNNILSVVAGAILYRIMIAWVLDMGLDTADLKMMSAAIVAIAISYPVIKERLGLKDVNHKKYRKNFS